MNVQDILEFSGYPTCTIKLTFLSVLRLRDDTDMVPSLWTQFPIIPNVEILAKYETPEVSTWAYLGEFTGTTQQ
jgi:hypothetical protein